MGTRVLVVDDDRDIALSLQQLLQAEPGCEVGVAFSFADASARLAEGWDVVLSDERLPDGRGVDLLAGLAQSAPSTARGLMSAFEDVDAILRGPRGVDVERFFQKPLAPGDVASWVKGRAARRARGMGLPPPPRAAFRRLGSSPPP